MKIKTYDELRERLDGIPAQWIGAPGGRTCVRTKGGAVLNWWPSTGGVQIQGTEPAKTELFEYLFPIEPTPSAKGTEARVISDITARQQLGIKKYGTTVADNPLAKREWLQHAYEEALDLAIYLRRAIDESE